MNWAFRNLFNKIKDFKEILIEYAILTVTYFFYPFSSKLLFPYLLALDGVYSSVAFFRLHSDNLTQSQILEQIGSIYNIDLIDRYIYYVGLSLVYEYLRLFFWLSSSQTYYLMFPLLAGLGVPYQINKLCKTWLNPSFSMLGKLRVKISRTICAFMLARIMNFLSLICVDLRPNIRTAELYPLMKTTTLSNTPKTLLNFLIATLVQYTQNNGRTMSSKLIRVLYAYNTGKKIGSVKSEEQAKEKIVRVIVERRFNELIRPDTLQTVFYLYQSKEDGLLYTFFTEFEYRILQIGTIFTLTKSILGLPAYVAAFFSTCLSLYRVLYAKAEHRSTISKKTQESVKITEGDLIKEIEEQKDQRHERIIRMMIGRVLAGMIGFFLPQDYLLVTLISELTYYLIIQFEIQILKMREFFDTTCFQDFYSDMSNMTLKSLLSKINYETRYLLVGLLVSKHWYSLLGALILGPNLLTSGILLGQALLLRISGFNWLHFCLFMIQSFLCGYYSSYLRNMVEVLRSSAVITAIPAEVADAGGAGTLIDRINLIQHLDSSYHPTNIAPREPLKKENTESPKKEGLKEPIKEIAKDVLKPVFLSEAGATKKSPVFLSEAGVDKNSPVVQEPVKEPVNGEHKAYKVMKDLKDMNDEEIEKAIAQISSQNLPSPNRGPIITDEATEAMMRSLRSKGIIPDLDKSIYLGSISSHLKPELVGEDLTEELSELYSEY